VTANATVAKCITMKFNSRPHSLHLFFHPSFLFPFPSS
jgi:hypothetical protein